MIDRYGGMETQRERERFSKKNKTKLSTGIIEEDMVCWQEQLLMSYRT